VSEIVTGTADQHVTALVTVDRVVAAVLVGAGLDRTYRGDRGRLDLLEAGVGLVRVRHLLEDRAVVAEHDVVVGVLDELTRTLEIPQGVIARRADDHGPAHR